jgi:serine phosphatase RsbU (regulator of sigma subunit)
MAPLDLTPLLRSALLELPDAVPAAIQSVAVDVGASDVVVYLVDFGQLYLEPLGNYAAHAELPQREVVASTMAGRAFLTQGTVTAERADGVRVWVPIREGSDRTGVLALTLPDGNPDRISACEDLGLLAGFLIAINARVSDVFNLHRRRKAMTLAASMQWDLLPPIVFRSGAVTVAGMLEPAYEVGGDCFDYAINWPTLDIAMMDSMGHGLNSAILSGLAVGCYRHDRRHGRTLLAMHQELDTTIKRHLGGSGFVTGQLAQLNVETGRLRWTNAGHPLPLLIRGGRVIGDLSCPPTLPWGIGRNGGMPHIAEDSLEPGDGLLFYTDGAIEGRASTGGGFGLDRLTDLVGQTASEQRSAEEIVRRLGKAIVDYHKQRLDDDATLLLVQWSGPAKDASSHARGEGISRHVRNFSVVRDT